MHEAYLRLVDGDRARHWNGRGHFFAAEAMRRILVDNARRKQRLKHGGARKRVELMEECLPFERPDAEILAVHEACHPDATWPDIQKAIPELQDLEPGELFTAGYGERAS